MKHKHIAGIIAATITPFTANGKINYAALDEMNDFLVRKGIHGLFPCGSTGEGILLEMEERKAVALRTVERVNGKIPVVIHTGAMLTNQAVELTQHAAKIGAAAAALIPPYYYNMDSICIYEYYKAVAQSVPEFPLFVYNIPANVKNVIQPEMLSRLTEEFPNIIGIKDSSMDFMNFINFKQAVPDGLTALMGNDAQIFSSLLIGGSGAVAATSTAFPEEVVAIYNNWYKGNHDKALAAQDKVIKLRAIFRSFAPIAAYKQVLAWRGIAAGIPRQPLRGLTAAEQERLRAAIHEIGITL